LLLKIKFLTRSPNGSLFHVPRVFGCTCFVHGMSPNLDDLCPRPMKCVFLGYSRIQKGYKCYSTKTKRYHMSLDVTFSKEMPFPLILYTRHYFYTTGFTLSLCWSYTISSRGKSSYTLSSRGKPTSLPHKQSICVWRVTWHVLHLQTILLFILMIIEVDASHIRKVFSLLKTFMLFTIIFSYHCVSSLFPLYLHLYS